MRNARLWQNLWVRLAVALAFADASIVVLALPQLLDRLHTSVGHVVWVIVAYNLALIATSAVILLIARRFASRWALVAGLAVFGLASLGCGAANSLAALIPLRCLQGVGGAIVLCASLPLFAGAAREGDSPLYGWSAAAAIGAAVGPAAGGVLTEIFSWRSIFFAQAPVAAVAAAAVLAVRATPLDPVPAAAEGAPLRSAVDRDWGPLAANLGLALLSAGLIGALFLVVIEMINAWLVSPLGAAAAVLTIPVATAVTERAVRGRSPLVLGAAGAILLALGLFGLSLISHRQLGWVVAALAVCGAGLGLGFPGLTSAALRSHGSSVARAARTVAARDAGLVLGLLALTPVFVNQLNAAPDVAQRQAEGVVIIAPLPTATKLQLAPKLLAAANSAPQSRPPDFAPVFRAVAATAPPADRVQLAVLERKLNAIVQRAVTHAFRRPLGYAALVALAVLPVLGAWALYEEAWRRRRRA